MRSARFLVLAALVVVFVMPALVLAQTSTGQEMSEQEKKMMEMLTKYGTPGKNHELLRSTSAIGTSISRPGRIPEPNP